MNQKGHDAGATNDRINLGGNKLDHGEPNLGESKNLDVEHNMSSGGDELKANQTCAQVPTTLSLAFFFVLCLCCCLPSGIAIGLSL